MDKSVQDEAVSYIPVTTLEDGALTTPAGLPYAALITDWQSIASNEREAREAAEGELASYKMGFRL